MCRLYGFRATEPTKIECTLVHAQNALIWIEAIGRGTEASFVNRLFGIYA